MKFLYSLIIIIISKILLFLNWGNEHGKDDYEKEMKQVELPEQFLWAQSDELRVQISIDVNLVYNNY